MKRAVCTFRPRPLATPALAAAQIILQYIEGLLPYFHLHVSHRGWQRHQTATAHLGCRRCQTPCKNVFESKGLSSCQRSSFILPASRFGACRRDQQSQRCTESVSHWSMAASNPPSRAKACIECRQQKVRGFHYILKTMLTLMIQLRCDAHTGEPCTRCRKGGIECIISNTFRPSKRQS